MVYGTGYVYPAYISPVVYYPPPVTYGVAVRYNPWTGWTVGFGYGTPFLYAGVVVGRPTLRRVVRSVWTAAISAAVLPAAVLRLSRVSTATAGLSSPAAGLPSATGGAASDAVCGPGQPVRAAAEPRAQRAAVDSRPESTAGRAR